MLAALVAIGGLALALSRSDLGASASIWPDPADPKTTLAEVEAVVSRKIPVPEIPAPVLRGALARSDTVTFDVREPAEYAQSHIAGATRIDPSLSAAAFAARFGNDIRGKTVVFYCAVGVRSGRMLERVRTVLAASGVKAAYNLRGGIFRWYASGEPVVSESGASHGVHDYDEAWGKLLARTLAAGGS